MGRKISAFRLGSNPGLLDQYLTYHAIGAQKTFRKKLCMLVHSGFKIKYCSPDLQ